MAKLKQQSAAPAAAPMAEDAAPLAKKKRTHLSKDVRAEFLAKAEKEMGGKVIPPAEKLSELLDEMTLEGLIPEGATTAPDSLRSHWRDANRRACSEFLLFCFERAADIDCVVS